MTSTERMTDNRPKDDSNAKVTVSYRQFIPSSDERRRSRRGYDPEKRMIALLGELSKIERGATGDRTESLKHLSYTELKIEFMKTEKEYIYDRYCT